MILVPTANLKPLNSATESRTTAKMNSKTNQILCGDSGKILATIPDHTVDLIFTSPPDAQQRQQPYAVYQMMMGSGLFPSLLNGNGFSGLLNKVLNYSANIFFDFFDNPVNIVASTFP